ncbi:UNVERIFIED_CONTAM: hypothetical protein ABIC26_003125, partial [Paenibacillus sp. PvR008]
HLLRKSMSRSFRAKSGYRLKTVELNLAFEN